MNIIHSLQKHEKEVCTLAEIDGDLICFLISCLSDQALTVIVKCFPGQIAKSMPAVLQATWKTLTDSADTYVRTVINDTEEADDPVDSDGKRFVRFMT